MRSVGKMPSGVCLPDKLCLFPTICLGAKAPGKRAPARLMPTPSMPASHLCGSRRCAAGHFSIVTHDPYAGGELLSNGAQAPGRARNALKPRHAMRVHLCGESRCVRDQDPHDSRKGFVSDATHQDGACAPERSAIAALSSSQRMSTVRSSDFASAHGALQRKCVTQKSSGRPAPSAKGAPAPRPSHASVDTQNETARPLPLRTGASASRSAPLFDCHPSMALKRAANGAMSSTGALPRASNSNAASAAEPRDHYDDVSQVIFVATLSNAARAATRSAMTLLPPIGSVPIAFNPNGARAPEPASVYVTHRAWLPAHSFGGSQSVGDHKRSAAQFSSVSDALHGARAPAPRAPLAVISMPLLPEARPNEEGRARVVVMPKEPLRVPPHPDRASDAVAHETPVIQLCRGDGPSSEWRESA